MKLRLLHEVSGPGETQEIEDPQLGSGRSMGIPEFDFRELKAQRNGHHKQLAKLTNNFKKLLAARKRLLDAPRAINYDQFFAVDERLQKMRKDIANLKWQIRATTKRMDMVDEPMTHIRPDQVQPGSERLGGGLTGKDLPPYQWAPGGTQVNPTNSYETIGYFLQAYPDRSFTWDEIQYFVILELQSMKIVERGFEFPTLENMKKALLELVRNKAVKQLGNRFQAI